MRVQFHSGNGERPVLVTIERELSRLLLNRLKVLMAALRNLERLRGKAAQAPTNEP